MALGDITILKQNSAMGSGSLKYNVAASATLINAGEPVKIAAVGDVVVVKGATTEPVVVTTTTATVIPQGLYIGIAATTSTNTAAAAGTVEIVPALPNTIFLGKPTVAASWDTQAEYDALVGKRVQFDLTTGSYTIIATDAAANGLVVMPLDIAKYPGRVAFAFRMSCTNLL